MMKPLHWICSRSAITAARRKGTQTPYNLQLLKWKRRSLNLLKMDTNLFLRLMLYLTCSLSTLRTLGFSSMWGSNMVRERTSGTNLEAQLATEKRMQSFRR